MSGPDRAEIDRALQAIVGEAHVKSSAQELAGLGVGAGGAPAWIVMPGSAAEVAEIIGLAGRHGIAVVPVGNAARSPRAAALDERMRLFVDTRRMSHVLNLDETSLVVHAQAGITGLALERVLAPRGLSVGDYPPAAMASTLGGLLSVRTPGKSSARHGFVEDAVLGVSAVLADGRSIHTRVAPRRATGPDLARLLCGSEGTLGFITSVVLRIHRLPEARFLAAHALPDFDAALAAVYLALREEAAPSALRACDAAEAHAQFGPEVCEQGEAVLVTATAGPTDLAACDRDLFASAAAAMGGRALPESVAETWWRRRMGRDAVAQPLPAMQVTAAPGMQRAVYAAVCHAVTRLGEGNARARAYASRFDHDGAVLFFTFTDAQGQVLRDGEELSWVRAMAESAAREAGAVLLASMNPGLDPYLDELRRMLDPRGIMNPGALRTS